MTISRADGYVVPTVTEPDKHLKQFAQNVVVAEICNLGKILTELGQHHTAIAVVELAT